ncbi:MAG: hypothetical protein ACKOB6_05495, partial [Candidatus Kapaibacterium sp.]
MLPAITAGAIIATFFREAGTESKGRRVFIKKNCFSSLSQEGRHGNVEEACDQEEDDCESSREKIRPRIIEKGEETDSQS